MSRFGMPSPNPQFPVPPDAGPPVAKSDHQADRDELARQWSEAVGYCASRGWTGRELDLGNIARAALTLAKRLLEEREYNDAESQRTWLDPGKGSKPPWRVG